MNVNFSHVLSKTRLTGELTRRLHVAVDRIFGDMQDINPLDLNISEYNQRYLKDQLQNLSRSQVRYACIIGGALSQSQKPLADMVFIEYGGGTGFLSLLAKRMGIGTVIYNDIYDVSCKDAKEIARILGCQAEHYVQGNIDDLIAFCNKHKIKCDIMASHDVLEHIYDVDDFCSKLHLLSHKGTTMIHAAGANMFHYPTVKRISRKQIEVERIDRQKQWGHKERDCLLAYLEERKKIIAGYASSLNNDEMEQLAMLTRGLMREDIIKVVDRYVQNNELPRLIEHPTNTCDPHTGNWMEHFMNPYYLVETVTFNGFDAKVLPLYYYEAGGSSIKNLVARLLNLVIRVSNAPLYFSGGYAIYAKYTGSFWVAGQVHKHHMYTYHRSHLRWYLTAFLWELLHRLRGLYNWIAQVKR